MNREDYAMPANGKWHTLGRFAKVSGIIVAVAALGFLVYAAYLHNWYSQRSGG